MPGALGVQSSHGLIDGQPGGRRQSAPLIWAMAIRRTKIALAVIGIAIVWPFLQIGLIAAQAQYLASGRPYCIDVVNYHLSYRPAVSLFELNGFTLHAPWVNSTGSMGFAQWGFHAVLVVEDGHTLEWRNWSYWHQHFDRLTRKQAMDTGLYDPACKPQRNFVWALPLFSK